MVIGNGLMAKAFVSYLENNGVIIFASGVSNSSISENKLSFQREENLLNEYLKFEDKKFIYFSTCSISDDSKKTPYIEHKIRMENIIKKNHNNYLIFRLPLVIGHSDNKNTFFNNIKSKISLGQTITVFENLTRYIIDVDDLSNLLPIFINSDDKNKVINVCLNNRQLVSSIIQDMEEIMSSNCEKIIKNLQDTNSIVDNFYFISKLNSKNYNFDSDYNKKVLKKYL